MIESMDTQTELARCIQAIIATASDEAALGSDARAAALAAIDNLLVAEASCHPPPSARAAHSFRR